MKRGKFLFLGFGLLFGFYLLIPEPKLPPPDLPNSLKSDLPGDTIQITDVSGYFTDQERSEVISFYQDYFSRSPFLGLWLPTVKLNHPPEYAKQVIRDTTQSYYLEELIHPLKGSLFINGFEWEEDVFTKPEKRAANKIITGDKVWRTKVTLRWFASKTIIRLLLFWLSWLLFWLVGSFWLKELSDGLSRLRRRFRK